MMKRLRALGWLGLTLLPAVVFAGIERPYQPKQFDELTAVGAPVVVSVQASWCPTCRVQAPILSRLMRDPLFANYTVFVVDFDKDRAALRRFRVIKQSTMIVFRGRTEVGRSIGDTNPTSIRNLMLRMGESASAGAKP